MTDQFKDKTKVYGIHFGSVYSADGERSVGSFPRWVSEQELIHYNGKAFVHAREFCEGEGLVDVHVDVSTKPDTYFVSIREACTYAKAEFDRLKGLTDKVRHTLVVSEFYHSALLFDDESTYINKKKHLEYTLEERREALVAAQRDLDEASKLLSEHTASPTPPPMLRELFPEL